MWGKISGLYGPIIVYTIIFVLMAVLKASAEAQLAEVQSSKDPKVSSELRSLVSAAVFFERITLPLGLLLIAITIASSQVLK